MLAQQITPAPSTGVTQSTYNNVNELTGIAAGGTVRFEGTTNKAVKSVTINSNPATLNWSKSFTGNQTLSSGDNTVSVVGTDGGNNTKTNTYKISTKGAGSQTFTYDANGNKTSDGTNSYD